MNSGLGAYEGHQEPFEQTLLSSSAAAGSSSPLPVPSGGRRPIPVPKVSAAACGPSWGWGGASTRVLHRGSGQADVDHPRGAPTLRLPQRLHWQQLSQNTESEQVPLLLAPTPDGHQWLPSVMSKRMWSILAWQETAPWRTSDVLGYRVLGPEGVSRRCQPWRPCSQRCPIWQPGTRGYCTVEMWCVGGTEFI